MIFNTHIVSFRFDAADYCHDMPCHLITPLPFRLLLILLRHYADYAMTMLSLLLYYCCHERR